jgi:hypothetical protein
VFLLKEKNNRIWIILLVLLVFLFILYFFLQSSPVPEVIEEETVQSKYEPKTDSSILEVFFDDPDEYMNEERIRSLSDDDANEIMYWLDRKIVLNCLDGEISDTCTKDFVSLSLKLSNLLESQSGSSLKIRLGVRSRVILEEVYLDMKNDFKDRNMEVSDLQDFTTTLLREYCVAKFFYLNENEEKDFWSRKIAYVEEKTHWDNTNVQIFYFQGCLAAGDITEVAEMTSLERKVLEERVCDITPGLDEIYKEDLCLVNDYLNIKNFCEIHVTQEDIDLVNSLVSKSYETNYDKTCREYLKNRLA